MRVTDPQAIKTITHPSDTSTEFDIWIGMSRDERINFTQEATALSPKEGETVSLKKIQDFHDKVVKRCLRGFRGIYDSDGTELHMNGTLPDPVFKKLKEVRVAGMDNIISWIGQEAFNAIALQEQEKKTSDSALITDSIKNTEADSNSLTETEN